jgi:hypothetical protein
VKAQQSVLSGIRPSREQHGPKVKVTVPPKKKTEVRNSREIMIFFEKNKVLGVEPNRVLNILEGI